jgi:hypothetical protein
MRGLLPLVLALAAGCAHAPARPAAWSVSGEGPAAQALALADAAREVYPGLPQGGVIRLVPGDAYVPCFGPKPRAEVRIVTGCLLHDGVVASWPTPFPCADLLCSALPHELAHAGGAATEGAADAGALLIRQAYQRRLP